MMRLTLSLSAGILLSAFAAAQTKDAHQPSKPVLKRVCYPEAVFTLFECAPVRKAMHPVIELSNGRILSVPFGSLVPDSAPPQRHEVSPVQNASRLGDRFGSANITRRYISSDPNIAVEITEHLRRNASSLYDGFEWDNDQYLPYLRTEVKISALQDTVGIKRIVLFDNAPFPQAKISGYTEGSMIVGTPTLYGRVHPYFAGVEHPMARLELSGHLGATWTPDDLKTGSKTFTLPNPTPGSEVSVRFDYTDGPHRLDIRSVQLYDENGRYLLEDRHEGVAGLFHKDNLYTVRIPADFKGERASLKFEFKPTTETRSNGKISVGTDRDPTFVTAYVPRGCDLIPGQPQSFTTVIGTASEPKLLRRAVLNYLNNERAHPYRLFPHYNSWYHLCINANDNPDPMARLTDVKCLKAMRDINKALHTDRGVIVNSYLWDDGWDDWNSLWNYHQGFPNGFKNLAEEAKKHKSGISAWLSPWGGYGQSRARRHAHGKSQGIDPITLDNPAYFKAFADRCLQMIHDYDMNMFKFDGIGAGTFATGSGGTPKDLDGLLRLIRVLRDAKANIFINCTVGTWASPFWTLFADSLWRQGEDCSYRGEGNKREQWVNYRDGIVYDRFASKAPMFPLNSLMTHGVIVSDRSVPSPMPRPNSPQGLTQKEVTRSFANEVWTSFGGGTDLQELYLSPELMTPEWWDIVANAVKWAKNNEQALCDVHWVGGSPFNGEVYGYVSWSPMKGIVTLRNPSSKTQKISGDLVNWLEIPSRELRPVTGVKTVYASDASIVTPSLKSPAEKMDIELPPFGVLLFEIYFQ